MKNKFKIICFVCFLLLFTGIIELTAQGFSISGSRLVDANGSSFVIRGISHAHCWYTDRTSAIADIASVGANAVRIVCSNGSRWSQTSSSELSNLISLCKQNSLIAIPEVHDTTGYGEEGAACSLSQAVSYWRNMQSVLNGQESYVLINIGNEPYGNNSYENWVTDTRSAIQSMRSAGFSHTLVVDAPNWGQDWSFTMRDNAQSIFDADPDRNTLLSVHMYGVFDTAAEVQDYISTVTGQGLPLLIGEFGHNHSDGNPDEDAIMSNAQSSGIGYIGWSWCGNSSDVSYLDMVNNWDPGNLTSWGQRIINGSNGISSTSRICSVYGGGGGTTTTTSTAGTTTTTSTAGTTTTTSTGTGNCDCGTCNWYGTNYPMCCDTSSGWGWYDGGCNRSCISQSTCDSQPGGGGGTTTTTSTASTTTTTSTGYTTTTTSTGSTTTTTSTGSTTTTTSTGGGGSTCSGGTTISTPFTQNGAGDYCWILSSCNYINSWNLAKLEINGVDFTNKWASASGLPAKIDGAWYITYDGNYGWSHFEAR